MNIIDTSKGLLSAYESGNFEIERWKKYADSWIPGAKELCLADMQECLDAGYSWETDYLPVLNGVVKNADKREEAVRLFRKVTGQLEEKILGRFGKTVDADVVMYLGLCNGAGWVTKINERTTVLLGIEKIIELDWCNEDDMNGLIIHEMGHVCQAQHGLFRVKTDNQSDRFLWQLFTEGVAMVFEQEIIGSSDYFHQDKDGWKEWCDRNEGLILKAFLEDLNTMTSETQRYFGDWVRFEGYCDTGYYIGAKFVRYLLNFDSFDRVITYDLRRVKEEFEKYCDESLPKWSE